MTAVLVIPGCKRSQAPHLHAIRATSIGGQLIALITHSYSTCERLHGKGFAIRQGFCIP